MSILAHARLLSLENLGTGEDANRLELHKNCILELSLASSSELTSFQIERNFKNLSSAPCLSSRTPDDQFFCKIPV